MTAWTNLVKKTYDQNKHKSGYELKHAMKDAKKVYKKGSHTHKKHMDTPYPNKGGAIECTDPGPPPVMPTLDLSSVGGSRRKRSSRKGGKRRRTSKRSCSMW